MPQSCLAQLLFWERFPRFQPSFWLFSQGFCTEGLPWGCWTPFQPCLGAPQVQLYSGSASSMSLELGKVFFAVSRVTAAEMGLWTVWACPAQIPEELKAPSGSGGCWGRLRLLPNGCITFPVTCRVSQPPRGPQRPPPIAHGQLKMLPASLFPHVQLLSNPAVCCVPWQRSAGACISTHSPSNNGVIWIIFDYLIPLKWLRALHKSPVASAEVKPQLILPHPNQGLILQACCAQSLLAQPGS